MTLSIGENMFLMPLFDIFFYISRSFWGFIFRKFAFSQPNLVSSSVKNWKSGTLEDEL